MMSDSLLNSPPPLLRLSASRKVIRLGGVKAIVLFTIILIAYVVQSQLTQYVQADLAYRQPYFLFYIAHSSFVVIFPLHLLFLTKTTQHSAAQYLAGLWVSLARQLNPSITISSHSERPMQRSCFPIWRLAFLISWMTVGVTFTSVLWYVAVSFAPISDITAIFNTNAFWAYILSILFHESHRHLRREGTRKWEPKKLCAVILACAGVFAVVYGGTQPTPQKETAPESSPSATTTPSSNLNTTSEGYRTIIGDLLTLISSISYAMYQVLYKKYAALPSASSSTDPHTSSPRDSADLEYEYNPIPSTERFAPPSPTMQIFIPSPRINTHILAHHPSDNSSRYMDLPTSAEEQESEQQSPIIPPPFAFHPNLLTSLIGLMTLLVLWIPLPVMAAFSLRQDTRTTGSASKMEILMAVKGMLPPDGKTWMYIMMIALSGVVYNGGFMVLLGLWGAVTTSVGNLLTIVLVLFSDAVLFGNGGAITIWSLIGSAAIVCAFGVLAAEMME